MRRQFLFIGVLGLGLLALVSGSSAATAVAGRWDRAVEVPGTAALNGGGDAVVWSVSCGAGGTCAAGGEYADGSGDSQAFVAGETRGVWSNAIEAPGTAALNSGGDARVISVSCTAAGDCAAGGWYTDGFGHRQAFVAGETNGTWSEAVEVPGTAELNSGGWAVVNSVSCPAAGACAAAGTYMDGSGHYQAFVADEANGTWGDAVEVPGTAELNSGGSAGALSISCAAAGDCAAGGQYEDGSSHSQAFVASETNGTWGDAVEVPGTGELNSDGSAVVASVSCAAAGACSAGGSYTDALGHLQAFVAGETNGTWGGAVEVPGTAALDSGGWAVVYSLACAAAGACAAGGSYEDGFGHDQAFVVDEKKGTWGNAVEVPGTAALNSDASAEVLSVSCASPGNCAAGGQYGDASLHAQAFVVNETNGTWGKALEVPGTAALNSDEAQVRSVSCSAPNACAAGGYYHDDSSRPQAFVADYASPPCVVPNVLGKPLNVAKAKIKDAHCSVGTIRHVHARAKPGRVVAQRPKPGRHLSNGAKIALTVSTG